VIVIDVWSADYSIMAKAATTVLVLQLVLELLDRNSVFQEACIVCKATFAPRG
jgi:hypothetical protein